MLTAPSVGRIAACPDCGRPKATAADVIRWRSNEDPMPKDEHVCWAHVPGSDRLYPDEETGAESDLLRTRLIKMRHIRDVLTCRLIKAMGGW